MSENRADLQIVAGGISAWAKDKKANISLASYTAEIEAWRSLTGVQHVSRILEIGCGSGLFSVSAIALGFADSAVGVEPAIEEHGTKPEDVKRTEEIVAALNLRDRVSFRHETFREMLQEPASEGYDLLVFRNSLHHLYERQHCEGAETLAIESFRDDLTAARALMEDMPYIYIMEASRPNPVYSRMFDWYRRATGREKIDWESKRTRKEWEGLLRALGFSQVKSTSLPVNKWVNHPIGRYIGRHISASFLITGKK